MRLPLGAHTGLVSVPAPVERCVAVPPVAPIVKILNVALVRLLWKAIVAPSGDQLGRPSLIDAALLVRLSWPCPLALALKTSLPWPVAVPVVKRWKASSAPSGDQSGAKSDAGLLDTLVC